MPCRVRPPSGLERKIGPKGWDRIEPLLSRSGQALRGHRPKLHRPGRTRGNAYGAPLIVRAIEQTCSALGYQVCSGTDDHALVTVTLGYQNHAGRPDHIQVELNFLYRICAMSAGECTARRFDDEAECSFTVLSIEELLAGKLTAMIDRQHPRDLYDLFRFKRENIRHDPELLRKLGVLFGSTLSHDLRTYNIQRGTVRARLEGQSGAALVPIVAGRRQADRQWDV